MKRLLIVLLMTAGFCTVQAQQQRVVRVFSNGSEVHSFSTAGTNRLSFSGRQVLFSGRDSWAASIQSIDSLTFGWSAAEEEDTAAVDTAGGVRICWTPAGVVVTNPFAGAGIEVSDSNGHVSVTSTIDSADITFLLRGSSSNGSLAIATNRKLVLCFDGLSLSNPNGPALKVSDEKRAALHLVGASALSDGADNAGKGVVEARGKLTFQGNGTLQIAGTARHGIQSSKRITMHGGTIEVVSAPGDGLNCDDFVMYGGRVNSATAGDGIDGGNGIIDIRGGSVSVSCSGNDVKGIGCDSTFSISGGTVSATVSGSQSKAVKTKADFLLSGGSLSVEANGTVVLNGADPSYCTGVKVGGKVLVLGGLLTAVCSAANEGGRAVSCDGDYIQSGGEVALSTAGGGRTTVGSGTSCTDGIAPACLNVNGNSSISGGSLTCTSTGRGGRGIVCDGNMSIGTPGGNDLFPLIDIQTSGAPVNASSGGGGFPGGGSSDYWKGLPKGIKVEDSLFVRSGHIMSYCSQTSGDPTGEAIETKGFMLVDGGTIEANAYDDAINAGTGLTINGGRIWAYSRGNDGIDCNGTYTRINGGTVIAYGNEVGIDAGTDQGGLFSLDGGTIFSQGGTMGPWDSPTSHSQKYLLLGSGGGGGGGGGFPPGGGGGGSAVNPNNGFCVRNSNYSDIMLFKSNPVTGSGFETGTKPPGGGGGPGGGGNGSIAISTPRVTAGTYTLFTTITIDCGTPWHGLYSNGSCTASGGTSVTAQ